jgi:hypothetical protein
LNDTSTTATHEWRTYVAAIPEGEDRVLDLRWFWQYDIDPGGEFHARLRLSDDAAVGVDLTNPVVELNFSVTGTEVDFEMFQTSLAIADSIRSFDLTFISGSSLTALGSMFIDDISVALQAAPAVLAGDYNNDGAIDAADYVVWRKHVGGSSLPNETVTPGIVDDADYDAWRAAYGGNPGAAAGGELPSAFVPEPSGMSLLMILLLGLFLHSRPCSRRRTAVPLC